MNKGEDKVADKEAAQNILDELIKMGGISEHVKGVCVDISTQVTQRKFVDILSSMLDTYKRKNHDYGDSFHDSVAEFGLVAAIVRMGDKWNRIKTLVKKQAEVKDESIRDTLLDLANYCVMTVMEMDALLAQEAKRQRGIAEGEIDTGKMEVEE